MEKADGLMPAEGEASWTSPPQRAGSRDREVENRTYTPEACGEDVREQDMRECLAAWEGTMPDSRPENQTKTTKDMRPRCWWIRGDMKDHTQPWRHGGRRIIFKRYTSEVLC